MKKYFTLTLGILGFVNLFAQGPLPRTETKLDQVYSQYGLDGEGVVIVLIDRGIDYRHPDFIDANGHTRIAYIFDMINNAGANDPNNPYGVGTIFDSNQINQALANSSPPLSMDRYGHGTAISGIACGNGTGTVDLKYHGVAPKAKLVVVKLVQDYFPAFGSQPQQNAFYDASYIPIALNFAKDKIQELGLPAVTLMNIGSIGGPTDGTSSICREIDDFVNDGNTFVCGVGDDGGADNHVAGTVGQGQTVEIQVNKGESGYLITDFWYSEDDRFSVSVERPNATVVGPFSAPTGPNDAVDSTLGDIAIYHRGASQEFYDATSNRRELRIDFPGTTTGVYKIRLEGTQIQAGGEFQATMNPSTFYNTNKFLTYVATGSSINDFASAEKDIAPGDYVVKNEWTDINGIFRDITGQGEDGELWLGSSVGPTQDNRMGIDLVAPGEVCFGAYSPDTWYSNFPHNMIQGGNSNYGMQDAVSAAAPLVTGIIALMLEVNPDLTPDEIKTILHQSCVSDAFTGAVPNNTWGYGKIDALQAIQNTYATLGTDGPDDPESLIHIFPNPAGEAVFLHPLNGSLQIESIALYNVLGQVVMQEAQTEKTACINLKGLKGGIYLVQIETNQGDISKRIVKQ